MRSSSLAAWICAIQNQVADSTTTAANTSVVFSSRFLLTLKPPCNDGHQEKPIQRPEAATVNHNTMDVTAMDLSTRAEMVLWS